MSNTKKKEKEKKMQEKYQAVLARLLREEDNKYCVDCEAKGPRWASWNLGIFLCIRCAGIHRNLGVHISKVKSVNLDSWTEEQIYSMEDTGNTVGRKLYEGNLPNDFRRPTTDSNTLEQFIRAKYEHKKYFDKNYVKPPVRHAVFEDPDKEKRKKSKGKSSAMLIQKPAESSDSSSVAKPVSQPKSNPAPVSMAAPARPPPNQSLTVHDTAPQKSVSLPTTPERRRKAAVDDLLGLDTPPVTHDLLGMSTPQHPSQPSNGNNVAANEVSLFGEETPSKPDQSSMKNKDSIMALYGSGNQKQTVYGVPGGMYIPAQGQQQAQPQQTPQQNQYNGYPNGMPAANMGMMGNQGMMGANQGMMGTQAMMGRQQPGMMPMAGMYNAQVQQQQQQQAYLNQIQQQMKSLQVGNPGMPHVSSCPQFQSPAFHQQTTGVPAGANTMGMGWGNNGSGQTLSTNLWK